MTKSILKSSGAFVTLALLSAGAVQSRSSADATLRAAESDARRANVALSHRSPDAAVGFAEHAVQLRPQDATYRALLGKAYLAAGRFASARQAFGDALQLDPGQSSVILNYALATTATGDFQTAHQILDANAAAIAPADRGLALALAGDPAAGVEVLTAAARAPDANAKVRQNLALALALAGRWPEARQMALADLSPSDADARIVEWAAFARPNAAADQVASLLGVTAVADQGQPVALALVSSPAQVAQVAPVAETPAPAAIETASVAPAVVATAPAVAAAPAVPPAAAPTDTPRPQVGNVVFGERHEVVQTITASVSTAPAVVAVAATAPARPAQAPRVTTPVAAAKGDFYVQLGAYNSADMAKWGWNRVRARHAVLAGKTPYTMPVGNGLVRVSVGGFARNDAVAMCRSIRAGHGVCFVRAGAGDKVASWTAKPVQLASR